MAGSTKASNTSATGLRMSIATFVNGVCSTFIDVSISLPGAALCFGFTSEAAINLARLLELREDMILLLPRAPAGPGGGQLLKLINPLEGILSRRSISHRLIAGLDPDWVGESLRVFCVKRITFGRAAFGAQVIPAATRSEEHTSELQSLRHLV